MANKRERFEAARKLAAKQAEDVGLWFVAQTAPEAYLQQELRKLHEAIEGTSRLRPYDSVKAHEHDWITDDA